MAFFITRDLIAFYCLSAFYVLISFRLQGDFNPTRFRLMTGLYVIGSLLVVGGLSGAAAASTAVFGAKLLVCLCIIHLAVDFLVLVRFKRDPLAVKALLPIHFCVMLAMLTSVFFLAQ